MDSGQPKSDLDAWLDGLGLGRYAQAFVDNDVDLDIVADLGDAELAALGMSLGDRKRLRRAISALAKADPDGSGLTADRRQLTVLFCDLVGSTPLSEKLDPEELRDVIRAYREACNSAIARFGGTVTRYVGDGILSVFGYPHAHENDAERAVRAAIALLDAVHALDDDLGRAKGIVLAVRVGIATGLVVAGDITGQYTSEHAAVVGRTPNLAARLQSTAEPGTALISERTRQLIGGLFELECLGPIPLKGLSRDEPVWRVIGETATENRYEATRGMNRVALVGRREELNLLIRRWELAATGHGQVVILSGEPGIGKSRLVAALCDELSTKPHRRLRLQCSPYHMDSALHAIITHLEASVPIDRTREPQGNIERIEALASRLDVRDTEALSLLADLLSIPAGTRYPTLQLTPEDQRVRTLELLADLPCRLARKHTVLLVVEDAHWIDPSSEEVLGRLARRITGLPMLILVTSRPSRRTAWADGVPIALLTLTRLRDHDSAAMVSAVAADRPLSRALVDFVVSKADGIPLFVEELTRMVKGLDAVRDAPGEPALGDQSSLSAIPSTLQDLLMAQLDRLQLGKDVAQLGAVIGREFSHALLARVWPSSATAMGDGLDELIGSGLAFRRGPPLEPTYLFKHALVQETAYLSLLRSDRQDYHARIADALESDASGTASLQPELVAHHLEQAGRHELALTYWERASSRAMMRSSHAEALRHAERGLRTLARLAPGSSRGSSELALEAARGAALRVARGYAAPEVEQAFAHAYALCTQVDDCPERAAVLWGLMLCRFVSADVESAYALAEELRAYGEHADDLALQIEGNIALGMTSHARGEVVAAHRHFRAARVAYDPQTRLLHLVRFGHDPGVFGDAYDAWGWWFRGRPDRAASAVDEAVDRARRTGHDYSYVAALTFAARVYHSRRDVGRVLAIADEIIERSRTLGFSYYLVQGTIHRGWALSAGGAPEEGIGLIRSGLDSLVATGTRLGRPGFLTQLAEALLVGGRPDEATRALDEAASIVRQGGIRYWDAEIERLRAEALFTVARGRRTEARAHAREALAISHRQQGQMFELRAVTTLIRVLDPGEERERLRDALRRMCEALSEGRATADWLEAAAASGQSAAGKGAGVGSSA